MPSMRLINFQTRIRYNRNGEIPKKVFKFFDNFVKCGVFGSPAKQYIKRRSGTGRDAVKAFRIGQLAVRNEYGTNEYTVQKDIIINNPRATNTRDAKFVIKKGTKIKIPARPAFRNMAKDRTHLNAIGRVAKEAVSRLLKGGSVRGAWKKIGDASLREIQASYVSKKFKENSKLTVALKGMNFPLVDHLNVYAAIHYKILSSNRETARAERRAWNNTVRTRTNATMSRLRG